MTSAKNMRPPVGGPPEARTGRRRSIEAFLSRPWWQGLGVILGVLVGVLGVLVGVLALLASGSTTNNDQGISPSGPARRPGTASSPDAAPGGSRAAPVSGSSATSSAGSGFGMPVTTSGKPCGSITPPRGLTGLHAIWPVSIDQRTALVMEGFSEGRKYYFIKSGPRSYEGTMWLQWTLDHKNGNSCIVHIPNEHSSPYSEAVYSTAVPAVSNGKAVTFEACVRNDYVSTHSLDCKEFPKT